MVFRSQFEPGDKVMAFGKWPGVITGVAFSKSKVTYDVDLDVGGETLRNVDSIYVIAPDPA